MHFCLPTPLLAAALQIPDKQYVLTALAARAKLRAWNDVDALFTTKVGVLTLVLLRLLERESLRRPLKF